MTEPAASRLDRLATLVAEEGFVRVADAHQVFGVSEVTIRSDLARLEALGRIRRVHGGAMPPLAREREQTVEDTASRAADLKRAIGRRTAALVSSGSSILLDVGSTTLAVARALVERSDLAELVVVTNGIGIALALEPAIPRFTVVVTGGTLRPLQHSLVAPGAVRGLEGLHADLAIIGCTGIDEEGRVTNVNLPETEIKRAMLAGASSAILVVDGSKGGQRHLGLVGTLDDFGTVVTAGPGTAFIRTAAGDTSTRVVEAAAIRGSSRPG